MLVVKTGIEVLRQKSKESSRAVSCELGLIETTEPTEGTQHREYWGGPTNGQAAACRRRLAAVELATPLHQKGGGVLLVQGA